MRTILITLLCLLSCCMMQAQSSPFTENFDTGLPSSAPGSETDATLASGIWKLKGVYGKTDNGSMRATMASGGYLITPPINKPTSVSFAHRGSGNGKVLVVEKSVDNGVSWSAIGQATVSSSSTYGTSILSAGEAGTNQVLIRFTCNSSTIYLDNVKIEQSNLTEEPTVCGSITASQVSGIGMRIDISPGNGTDRLLVYRKGSAVSFIPEDGVTYTNLPKNEGDQVIAYFGNGGHADISGLEAGETYYFSLFESAGDKDAINYLTSSVATCIQRTLEIPSISVSTPVISFGAVKTGTTNKRLFQVSAKYLEESAGNIVLSAAAPFALSVDNAIYSPTLELPYSANGLSATEIYVRFEPEALISYRETLSLQCGNTTAQITLQGEGSDTDAKVYYISPSGNDTNEGSFDSPWYNLQRAVNVAVAGDTIICRGGIYYPNLKKDGTKTTIRLTASGEAGKRITIRNFPDEFPVFNFRDQPKKQSVRGVQLDGDYWHIRGCHFTEAGDNGIKVEGNHNIIEKCTFSYNDDTGLQLGFGHNFSDSGFGSSNDGSHCAYNDIIDCDSYLNCDSDNFGSDADGFACKMHNGKENRFIRCRAWDNADDAWDLYETDYPVYLIECWAWGSGRAELFGWVQAFGSFQGNGNGIKLGGNGTGGSSKGKHEAWNCVAFNCNKTGSVKGFDQNSHNGGVKLVNCLAFGSGYDFMFEKSSTDCEYYNNVCFGKIEIKSGATESNNAMLSTSDKAWTNVIRGFSESDYISLSEEDAKAPRGADGSMPQRFARLKKGSVLVNQGLDLKTPMYEEFPFLWQPIYGGARDLGPYELEDGVTGIEGQILLMQESALSLSVYPNPIRSNGQVAFSIKERGNVSVDISTLQGVPVRRIIEMNAESNVKYTLPFNVSGIERGIYLLTISANGNRKSVKMSIGRE